MLDVLYLGFVAGFLALSWALVELCDRLSIVGGGRRGPLRSLPQEGIAAAKPPLGAGSATVADRANPLR